MTTVGAVLALILCGAPLAWSIVARWLEAVLLAPIVGALAFTVAAIIAVVTSTPTTPWAMLAVAGAWGTGAYRLARGRRGWRPSVPVRIVLPALVFAALPVVTIVNPPVDWDAHSIWFNHAGWFAEGGTLAHDAFATEAFSHPDYPPLLPASAGVASSFTERRVVWRTLQAVTTTVTWSAMLLGVAVLFDVLRRRRHRIGWLLAALLPYAVCAQLVWAVANGEADFGVAAFLLLSAAALVVHPSRELRAVGLIGATAAALCKGEAFTAVPVLLLLSWWLHGRPRDWRYAIPLAAGVSWVLVARFLGARNDVLSAVGDFRPASAATRARAADIVHAFSSELWMLAAVIVAVTVALLLAAPRARGIGRFAALVAAGAYYFVTLGVVYLVGPADLDWWLRTSLARTVTGGELLLTLAAVVGAVTLLDATGGTGAQNGQGSGRKPTAPSANTAATIQTP